MKEITAKTTMIVLVLGMSGMAANASLTINSHDATGWEQTIQGRPHSDLLIGAHFSSSTFRGEVGIANSAGSKTPAKSAIAHNASRKFHRAERIENPFAATLIPGMELPDEPVLVDGPIAPASDLAVRVPDEAGQDFIHPATPVSSVPEPRTVFAGAMLLLPLGATMIKILRRNKQRATGPAD